VPDDTNAATDVFLTGQHLDPPPVASRAARRTVGALPSIVDPQGW
jgi:hypothetical protein